MAKYPIYCISQQLPHSTSTVNLTLVPGLSSVGLDPSNHYSYLTFNIFSGYQRGNYWFQLSGISSATIEQANGIQIAGLANIVGVDYYRGLSPKAIRQAEKEGDTPFLNGIQFSGLMNYVRGQASGGQIAVGANIAKKSTTGAQLGGLLNYSGGLLIGIQLGGLASISRGSTMGFQTALYNRTFKELSGFQVGLANWAGSIEGKNSVQEGASTGVQLGLVNFSGTMNGLQIGLINVSGNNQGTQIGLINVYKTPHKKRKPDSTPFGLLNIGNSASVEAFVDETFLMNFAISTGNIKNGGLLPARSLKRIMNQIIYRQSHFSQSRCRAYGWNWQKQWYNYSPDITGEFYFFSLGFGTSYVDFTEAERKTNLLSEIGLTVGSRLFYKNRSTYLYATVDANYFYSNDGQTLAPDNLSRSFGEEGDRRTHELWPGLVVGLKVAL
ncbi:MAG: LA_2272 family surface repeat-containing protein [Cyclobacteriaceae bacterium]